MKLEHKKATDWTVASEIVKVQPMSLPAELLFYLDYTYGSLTSLANIVDKIKIKHQKPVSRLSPKRRPGKRKPR